MQPLSAPSYQNNFYAEHIALLTQSYQKCFAKPLLEIVDKQLLAQQIFTANFALLSHNNAADPCFNYANQTALELFELSWEDIIGMPSRLSAEAIAQSDRESLLKQVSQKGYIANYSGVRISKTGRRFLLKNALVWNIFDHQQQYYGQAAYFTDWLWL